MIEISDNIRRATGQETPSISTVGANFVDTPNGRTTEKEKRKKKEISDTYTLVILIVTREE